MDDRKLRILTAVVDEYILTGEPVGSKAIMKHVKASSATIRNEMAELEKQGYLEQPHTSAGRVPTYNGYRLYVDKLVESDPLSEDEKKELDDMLGMISKVEVIPTGKRMYVILMVTSSGTIKNKAFRLEFDLDSEQLEFFNNFVKENLDGLPLSELSDEYVDKLVAAMGAYMMTLSPIFSEVIKMTKEIRSQDVKVKGHKNLLTCKDFNQNEIISFLDDDTQQISKFIDETFSDLHVMFSDEKDDFVIHNSSVITAPYRKNGKNAGSLGLIGPMRLDYKKFIPYLEYFTDRISQMLTEHDSQPVEIEDSEDNG